MAKPLISIIIPCYNIEPYIGRCLESVLKQTYENLEVVCVNDGSKDDTGKVLDEYAGKDTRIKVIHKENAGVTAARFSGLDVAQGEGIGFVDGDDVIDADMYERLMSNVTDEIDISHCGFRKILPDGTVDYFYNTGNKIYQDGRVGYKDLLEAKFIEPAIWNKLYRRTLFEGLQHWLDSAIRINEDVLMNFYLFRKSRRSVYEDFCPYEYILRENSAAATVSVYRLYDPLKVLDILVEELKDDEELLGLVKERLAYCLICSATLSYGKNKDIVKPFLKIARKRLRKALKSILKGKCYSKKTKLSALWACIWPASYCWAHIIYRKHHYRYRKAKRKYKWL